MPPSRTRDDAGRGRRPPNRAAGARRLRHRARAHDGQATVELIALLPCLAALLIALWQLALAGHAVWAASAAARAAARAHALGTNATAAARAHLPSSLERGLRVESTADGDVRVLVRIPRLPGVPDLGSARATAHFAPQS